MDSATSTKAPRLRRLAAVAAVAALSLGGALVATAPASAAAQEGELTGAQLRWGFANEASSGAYAGGCNFLSAGAAGNSGSARPWTQADGFYSASEGNVSIVKPDATGALVAPTWATKCLDANGKAVNVGSPTSNTGTEVVIDGGTGTVDADGNVEIEWDGSFTVVFYGGYTYWTATDPVLTLDAEGNGQLTATAGGYGASMEDLTKWEALTPTQIVLADITGAAVSDTGFTVTPDFLGVSVNVVGGTPQVAKTTQNEAFWGSFPQSFVDFQQLTGQSSYWYSSGGARDAAKPTRPIHVAYTLETPPVTPENPNEQEIGVEVPVVDDPATGEFGWAFASATPVSLGTAAQQGDVFRATGKLNDIVVTDTRTGGKAAYTWSISGQVGVFADGAKTFSGEYLGWTPAVSGAGAGVTAGTVVTSKQLGGAGLATSSVLATSTSAGNATIGADLELVIPKTTAPGAYKTKLTVTALS
ncbi:hypothetical protein ET445_05480 [Agromyces protaetiae]|uniref:Htaa domain-containing protein n=1 Tax=Agromyces protaetiae TaxID=2509455 RepID=A0A4P6FD30_9MICO|nr:hypothetical protein [Agromyces protaetiae]QAY72873.1 hypothetical protein ET445_05480 [Agromyces protaetiae]